jgi:hypothetical protein
LYYYNCMAFCCAWAYRYVFLFPYGVYIIRCGRLMGELTRQHLGNCPRVVRTYIHTHKRKTNFLKVLVKKEKEEKHS